MAPFPGFPFCVKSKVTSSERPSLTAETNTVVHPRPQRPIYFCLSAFTTIWNSLVPLFTLHSLSFPLDSKCQGSRNLFMVYSRRVMVQGLAKSLAHSWDQNMFVNDWFWRVTRRGMIKGGCSLPAERTEGCFPIVFQRAFVPWWTYQDPDIKAQGPGLSAPKRQIYTWRRTRMIPSSPGWCTKRDAFLVIHTEPELSQGLDT